MWGDKRTRAGGGAQPHLLPLTGDRPTPIAKHTRTPQRTGDSEKPVIETNRWGKGEKEWQGH